MVDVPRRTPPPGRRRSPVGPLVVAILLAGCTPSSPRPQQPDPDEQVRLAVTTVSGRSQMSAAARSTAESAVGEVLSRYLSAAYLGDHPRTDYVRALEVFTDGAATLAARDLDVLTAAGLEDVQEVRATTLEADLSWFVVDRRPVAATARVRFDFDTRSEDESAEAGLAGRLMLVRRGDSWAVFGYDVADPSGAKAETS
jgi:hypothetical protein